MCYPVYPPLNIQQRNDINNRFFIRVYSPDCFDSLLQKLNGTAYFHPGFSTAADHSFFLRETGDCSPMVSKILSCSGKKERDHNYRPGMRLQESAHSVFPRCIPPVYRFLSLLLLYQNSCFSSQPCHVCRSRTLYDIGFLLVLLFFTLPFYLPPYFHHSGTFLHILPGESLYTS